jgi:hypothetical protein
MKSAISDLTVTGEKCSLRTKVSDLGSIMDIIQEENHNAEKEHHDRVEFTRSCFGGHDEECTKIDD